LLHLEGCVWSCEAAVAKRAAAAMTPDV